MHIVARGLTLSILALVGTVSASDAFGQSENVTGVGRATQIVSEAKAYPGDDPKHEIVVTTRVDEATSSVPDCAIHKATVVAMNDHVAGVGTQRTYRTTVCPNGDKTFAATEGKSRAGDGGVILEGRWWYLGGTGRYQGIRGGGTYRGTAAPHRGLAYEFEGVQEVPARQ